MPGGNADGGTLELKQLAAELRRNAELGQAGPGFLGQVVGHLHIYLVRRDERLPRPALVNNLHQLAGDVDAPAVVPSVLEPSGQLLASVVIEHIDVEFALPGKTREGQVAAAQVAHDGVDRVGPEQQVQLGVERMAEEQLHDDLLGLDLASQPAQARFIFVGGRAYGQLVAELHSQPLLQTQSGLVVDFGVPVRQAQAVRSSSAGSRCMPTSDRQQCPSPPDQRSTNWSSRPQPRMLK